MKNLWDWAIVGLAVIAVYFVTENVKKYKIKRLMAGRPAYTPQEFGEQLFPAEQAEIAARFRGLLSKYVSGDLSRLSPDDRLVQDLGIGQVDGLEPTFLVQDVEKAFGISIPDEAGGDILTVGQFVSYIARLRKGDTGTA